LRGETECRAGFEIALGVGLAAADIIGGDDDSGQRQSEKNNTT
jgi:hypothetical protein